MPVYLVTSPDGRKLRVTAPDGATKDDAIAYAQKQMADAQPQESTRERLARENPAEYDSQSPEYQAKYGSTSGMSGYEKFMAGAGKSVVDLGRGIRQIGAEALDFVSPRQQTLSDLVTADGVSRDPSRGAEYRRQQDEINKQDAALMQTGAGVAGNIAGALATTVLPASIAARGASALNMTRAATVARGLANPTTYRAAAASGAVLGALQPVGTDGSRAFNAAAGGAAGSAGLAVANTIGRIGQPIKKALTPQDARAVSVLKAADVPLDAAQRTGSRAAQMVKRTIADNPLTSPGQAAFIEKQQRGFTRAVLRSIGANSDSADEAVMLQAKSKISKQMEDVLSKNNVRIAGGFVKRVNDIATRSRRLLPGENNQITQTVDDILAHASANGGKIDGKYYNNLRGDIASLESERGLAPVARELRELMDNAFTQAAKPGDAKKLVEARRLWRNMKVIEGAIDSEGNGMISASKLANAFSTKRNRSVGVYGQGDRSIVELAKLAKAGKRLLPDKFPNSGTAQRIAGQLALPAVVGGVQGYREGDVGSGIKAAALTAGALYGARGAMNNQLVARYLAEGLSPGLVRNALVAPRKALPLAGSALVPALQD